MLVIEPHNHREKTIKRSSCLHRVMSGSGPLPGSRRRVSVPGVPGSGFQVPSSGFRVPGSGFRVSDFGFGPEQKSSEFRVPGFGFRRRPLSRTRRAPLVACAAARRWSLPGFEFRASVSGVRVPSFGFRVPGLFPFLGFQVSGFGFGFEQKSSGFRVSGLGPLSRTRHGPLVACAAARRWSAPPEPEFRF